MFTFFHASADVVEKKNPFSMPLRYEELRDVVATTLPCAFVERRALPMFEMARLVVVAFVAVAFAVMIPPLNVKSDVVAFDGNGSVPPPSVPQLKTPNWLAFTSQDTAFKFETIRLEVDALPVIAKFLKVDVAVDVATIEGAVMV